MSTIPSVLVIEDDASIQRMLCTALATSYQVQVASSGEEGLKQFEHTPPDLVLLDLMLPQMSGISVLRALKKIRSDVAVIMMTAFAQVSTAVEAIKLGATDYLEKPVNPQRVMDQMEQILAARGRGQSPVRCGIVGGSPVMKRVWRLVERFGPTDIPILLQGETGTGKTMFARALHECSKRAKSPFVDIDCSTIPEQLAESELFGYEDGAFTGAGKKKPGRVVFANRGTLFLDEIGVLGLSTQSKLLTLIEQQAFIPLGARDARTRHVDIRFIAATNVPLQNAIDNGSFRGDLYHRLNGITIALPPLRERHNDIELLALHFLGEIRARYGRPELEFSPDSLEIIRRYSWPGNIRELQRVISAAVIMADRAIEPDDLPDSVKAIAGRIIPSSASGTAARIEANEEAEPPLEVGNLSDTEPVIDLGKLKEWVGREAQKRVIEELQKRTNASQQELARMLGVDPKTLRSRLKEMAAAQS